MRTVRTLLGVLLVFIGVLAVAAAAAGWTGQRHAGPGLSFSAPLSPIRTDGYAITVPDVSAVLGRHVAASVLGPDRIRLTVDAASAPVMVLLVRNDELAPYLDGVARTELSSVGLARGPQPVQLNDIGGTATPRPLTGQSFWTSSPSGQSLEWDRSTDSRASLMIVRVDGQRGLAASLTVSVYPTWLGEATWIAMFTGVLALTAAALVLFRRGRRGLGGEHERLLEFADLVAQRLAERPALDGRDSRESPVGPAAGFLGPAQNRRDLTGELVQVSPVGVPTTESPYVHTAT